MKKLMEQTKLGSFTESLFNVGSGFIVAMITWMYVLPVEWLDPTDVTQSIKVTITFTFMSIVRGYTWRRVFEKRRN